jgi:ATP-dependent metalloprotease
LFLILSFSLCSGADLFNLVNTAALHASTQDQESIDMRALEYSKDKILMGAERRSAVITPEGAKMTAYHEGGHALVALRTAGADPVHKATIMPRGQALGMVMQLPDKDQTSMSRKQMLARLDVCMGGRVAEEMIFGYDEVTSGASSDIQQATSLARRMVTQWGMSDKVGVVFHSSRDDPSPEQKAIIDQEVQKLLTASYERATNILKKHRRELDIIARALIDRETLTGSEIDDLLAGRSLKPAFKLKTLK